MIISAGLLVAASAFVHDSAAQTNSYTVVELSAPDAGQVPCKINNQGDLVGRSGQFQATRWSHDNLQRKHLSGVPKGDYSSAFAINDAGVIAGATNTNGALVPFVWKGRRGLKRIRLLPGDIGGQGFGINKSGHVVGYSSGPGGTRAFLWTRSGGTRNLGSLPGGTYSRAREVNDKDQVAGMSGGPAGNRAVLWDSTGGIRDLGTLPGDKSSEALAISNAGEVVGYSKGPRGFRAFLWTPASGMQQLGVLPGGDSSRALDINDSGFVVGTSTSSSGDHAFVWTRQDGMKDLNNAASAGIGVAFVEAHAINNTGQILVMGKATPDQHPADKATFASVEHDCAPAPPSAFLLIPTR